MEEEEEEQSTNTTKITPYKLKNKIKNINKNKKNLQNGRLPLDSLLQIWSHLPTTSLYRLRTICHFWNHNISTDPLLPSLRHRLPSLHLRPPTLLLILRHLPSEPVKHPDRPARLSIKPACSIITRSDPNSPVPTHPIKNGFTPYADSSLHLLPLSDFFSPLTCFCSQGFFYLCNPSINQFLRVSPGHNGHLTELSCLGQNGHSPSSSTSTENGAFGYFRHDNRYALVNISGTKAETLEFGPGQAGLTKWREINSSSPAQVRGFGLMVDGRFFWTAANGPGFVVCLDYKQETFSLIPPMEGNFGEVMLYDKMYLVSFKGAVCAVDNFSRPPRMEIWVLCKNEVVEEEGFYWARKYNVLMTGMGRDLVYPFCDYYFYDDDDRDERKVKEKNELIVLCNGTRSRLYCYNLKSRSIRQVYKPKQRSFEQLALYTPGLFPLITAL